MPETLQGRPPARKLAGFRDIFKHEEFLAEIVCGRFFHQRPEYEERFRQVCREDITHTLRYLACSVDSGRFDLFRSYLLWLRELLEKRNLPVGHLTESLAIMREELEPWLQEPILVTTHAFLEQGVTLLETPWSEVHSR